MHRGTVHLLLGPVASGKSTYGRRRAAETSSVFLDVDTWMVRLFGDDERPAKGLLAWYFERRDRCRSLLWDVARDILDSGNDVVIEMSFVRRAERLAFYQDVRAHDLALKVYLLEAPEDVRWTRVEQRNHQEGAQVLTRAQFEMASQAWEPLNEDERSDVAPLDL